MLLTTRPSYAAECSDSLLVAQALDGEKQAFEALLQKYHAPLIHYIARRLGDYDLAYDVLQHVFFQLHVFLPSLSQSMFSYSENPQLKGWLFQMAQNRCTQELRKKKPLLFSEIDRSEDEEGSLLRNIVDKDPTPEEEVEYREMCYVLEKALQSLSPKARKIVTLRYHEGMSFQQISRVMGIPENTAKTMFHRTKPLLKAALRNGATDRDAC